VTYEVFIDVRHHDRHCEDWEKTLSRAFKLGGDEGDDEGRHHVTYALRDFADSLDGNGYTYTEREVQDLIAQAIYDDREARVSLRTPEQHATYLLDRFNNPHRTP